MIKNNNQLAYTEKKLVEVRKALQDQEAIALAINPSLYSIPLQIEEKKLQAEIDEYETLNELNLQDAVNDVLSEPILLDNIGQLLAKLRIAAKLTQAEIAQTLGWEQSNLSRFESENYSSQTVSKIVEYASALGVWLHVRPSLSEIIEPTIRTITLDKIESLESEYQNLTTTEKFMNLIIDRKTTKRNPYLELQWDDSMIATKEG